MSIHVKALVAMLMVAAILSGCRYHYKLPYGTNRDRLAIDIIRNDTFENELTPLVRSQITKEISAQTPIKIVQPSESDLTLRGTIQEVRRIPLKEDQFDNVEQFRLSVSILFKLYDKNGKELWQRNIGGTETFDNAGAQVEQAARRKVVNDITIKLIHSLFPLW